MVVNTDVAYTDLALPPEDGTAICIHLRAVGGGGSWGVHYGQKNSLQGHVIGTWAIVYTQTSMMVAMYNKSSVINIPKTRLTKNTDYLTFPNCPIDAPLGIFQLRSCHKEWAGEGAIFWWTQSTNYDAMNVP